jgi:hypothetical protein
MRQPALLFFHWKSGEQMVPHRGRRCAVHSICYPMCALPYKAQVPARFYTADRRNRSDRVPAAWVRVLEKQILTLEWLDSQIRRVFVATRCVMARMGEL